MTLADTQFKQLSASEETVTKQKKMIDSLTGVFFSVFDAAKALKTLVAAPWMSGALPPFYASQLTTKVEHIHSALNTTLNSEEFRLDLLAPDAA